MTSTGQKHSIPVHTRLTAAMVSAIDLAAKRAGETRSGTIRRLVRESLIERGLLVLGRATDGGSHERP